MKIYGLIALMSLTMFVSVSEAREGLFSRLRAARFGGSSGASVSGGSSGYSASVGSSGYSTSGGSSGYSAPSAQSFGSNGGTSYGSTGGSGSVQAPIPMMIVPMTSPIYESTPGKVLPRVLPRVRAMNCPNGNCSN
mgnify:FL=1